jgi:hypothetical protein
MKREDDIAPILDEVTAPVLCVRGLVTARAEHWVMSAVSLCLFSSSRTVAF